MNPVLLAAIAGAIGGGAGGGAAWALGKMLRRQPAWLAFLPIFGAIFAASLSRALQPSSNDRLMAEIDQVAPFQAIKAHYPQDYARIEAGVRQAASAEAAGNAANAVLVDVIIRQKPTADTDSAVALYQVTRAEGRALQQSDPEGCAAFMDGRPAPGLDRVQTPALREQDRQASASLLDQTASRPAPPAAPMTIEELSHLSLQAITPFPETEQALVIDILKSARVPKPGAESKAMCDFNLALADVILAKPPTEAGTLIRRIWAMR